jgi:soluble lytic murein transglycosylase
LISISSYLIAALMAQESTFDAGIRSAANAWGLMQILPSTGRQYARILKIPGFTTASLTNPEINVRIGTTYFAGLIKRFGGVAPALASYNAGESRVDRWLAERPAEYDLVYLSYHPLRYYLGEERAQESVVARFGTAVPP